MVVSPFSFYIPNAVKTVMYTEEFQETAKARERNPRVHTPKEPKAEEVRRQNPEPHPTTLT